MAAPSYAFYTETFMGTLSEEEFNSQLSVSVAHVDWLIGWKPVPEASETAYEMAVCACVDIFSQYGTTDLEGFQIGSFRMDKPSGGRTNAKSLATDAAYEFLAPTGLLWSGVR